MVYIPSKQILSPLQERLLFQNAYKHTGSHIIVNAICDFCIFLINYNVQELTFYRKDCYRCILETLKYLMFTSHSHPQAPSVPQSPGPPPTRDPTQLTNAEAGQYVSALTSVISIYQSSYLIMNC